VVRIPAGVVAILVASAGPMVTGGPLPQQTAEAIRAGDTGIDLFKTYCASCHGKSAKGDGPLAQHLRTRPPDLTLLAKRMGGKFQADKVSQIIDGRKALSGHGGEDMPVWGDAFKHSSEGLSEKAVAARIQTIVDYLASIQAK